ncbi:MAG: NAD-dependent epimerase/dehydratase family protein [Zetaproteobacteria bacterium]|nr:NAD-dependent epimerase/dehydratase family protein [Zetaproteobacteria bacterium]
MRILITGGAGFVGSSLAKLYRRDNPQAEIVVFDNLKRRGAELNLPAFKEQRITFCHGDIRNPSDLNDLPGNFDMFIEASAEPSVHAGTEGSPHYLLDTNLVGTLNCLEFARKHVGQMTFLSTSRVYSIADMRAIAFSPTPTRLTPDKNQGIRGLSAAGITEDFETRNPRSLYGASKLASELIAQEYAATYGTQIIINRCGVLAGAGQFGKVDQGVFTLWVAHHYFGLPLTYMGFGGEGKQVRDLLHPEDLYRLLQSQAEQQQHPSGQVFNVGGGNEISTSLYELTQHCQSATDRSVPIGQVKETRAVDIPYYVSDNHKATQTFGWKPQITVPEIVQGIYSWIRDNEKDLAPLFT